MDVLLTRIQWGGRWLIQAENVLRKVVPREFFYNAMITGVKPGAAQK